MMSNLKHELRLLSPHWNSAPISADILKTSISCRHLSNVEHVLKRLPTLVVVHQRITWMSAYRQTS